MHTLSQTDKEKKVPSSWLSLCFVLRPCAVRAFYHETGCNEKSQFTIGLPMRSKDISAGHGTPAPCKYSPFIILTGLWTSIIVMNAGISTKA